MRVLLIAMPDTISALDAIARIPNLGLCSIAGNLDNCEVKVIDLAFHNRGITGFLSGIVKNFQPDVIGLSAMSHQYDSACRVSMICRNTKSDVIVVLGGYHASLLYREIYAGDKGKLFDFIVRGEGEKTFNALVKKLTRKENFFNDIPGLSYYQSGRYYHNTDAPLLELETLKPPDRGCRLLDNAQFLGLSFDCVETSRGCTMGCRFCSIGLMYGRRVRRFPLERVIKELKSLKARGTRGVFFVDDNITLDVPRLKNLCGMIINEGLDTLSYVIQASVPGIASDPELAGYLKRAGFRWVFLGIENGIPRNLQSMGKEEVLQNTRRAVSLLRAQGICVFGGFIIGNPLDTKEDIWDSFKYAREVGVDHPIIQCLTPYPETQTRRELLEQNLITNREDFSRYNGFTCNVRTKNLTTPQLNKALFWGGLRLYFHPKLLIASRFWNYRLTLIPALVLNNFRYLIGAWRGKIFASRHSW
ncbi:MAG TPA: radical SAM protein [Dehalococcoidales bacterium]|nr:radical SAM protein [Dehalococcoidales bacterium]